MDKYQTMYQANENYSNRALELYKENIEALKEKLSNDESSFFCPMLCNNEINFYLPKKDEYVMYISDRYFIKHDIKTRKIIKKHELPPELFPNQIKSITTDWKKNRLLILITRKRAAYLEIYVYDVNTGKFNKVFIYEGKKKSLSLSKNQGFKDEIIYQSRRLGETTLKSYNMRINRPKHLFCLDPNPESLRTYIPCMIRKLGLVFVMSFNSEEQHFKMNVYNFYRRKLVVSFSVDHQINWFISQHNRLTVMYYDTFSVIFSINVLLFFIDLKRKSCRVFSYFDRPIAGIVKKISPDEEPPKLGNLDIIEYDGYFIAVADDDFVFTYKNQLRRMPNGDIFYLCTSDVVNIKNGIKIAVRNLTKEKALLQYYCLGVNPYEFQSMKMGDREIFISVKHREFNRDVILEVFKLNIETKKREIWMKNLGVMRGIKFRFLTFSEPYHHKILIFYVKNGISLHFRIFDLIKNQLSPCKKLIDDSGPMDVLTIDDNLNFIFNFRFTGIMRGNFEDVQTFEIIPGTDHIFGMNMTQYGENNIFYHLIDDFRRTRLERVNFNHNPPTREILFPDDRDFVDMSCFSGHTILSYRDDLLFFYDCINRVKRSYRIPEITSIRKVMNFKKIGDKIFVTFTEKTFNNVYDVFIENEKIVGISCDKMKYNSDKCLIYSNGKKYYQVSDDHFYDMEKGIFINPDYKRDLTELFEREVENSDNLGEVLVKIAHMGYKFSKYFGRGTVFQEIFKKFGNERLIGMYKINYDLA